jgi:site-specific DNA recombinase
MRQETEATGGKGLRVCAYYRMSDDEQKLSIDQQKQEVRKFCASRGWIIVEEYIDSGKSGSKEIAKRHEFHRLISDAKFGKWNCIVCYNTSRFGRLDSISGGQFKDELRKHRIYLETVTEGRIDWNTSMGRIQDAILSESNHKYSTDLSDSIVRGRLDIFSRGYWPVGAVPFGYDRQFVENGVEQMVISRTRPFKKPRNWHSMLKVNAIEAAIVRDIFKRFANGDISARALVKELNDDKVPSPGSYWQPQMLIRVLSDSTYIGQMKLGHARKSREAHQRIEQRIVEDAMPKIIDRKVWDKVAEKLQSRAGKTGSTSQARSGALSGILICGHCGYPMEKRNGRNGRNDVFYVCSSGMRRQHLGCKQWSAKESDLLPVISKELLAAVDMALLEKLHAKPKDLDRKVDQHKDSLKRMEKAYERARSNLLLADPELFATLQADALKLKSEMDKARNTLVVLENENARESAERLGQLWNDRKDTLVKLSVPRIAYRPHDPMKGMYAGASVKLSTVELQTEREDVRELLKSLKATLTLHWSPAGGRYHQLTTGELAAELSEFGIDRKNVLSAANNKCNRVHSRDTD